MTGKVASLTYKKGSNAEVSYFYVRNLQGDIIAVYRSSDSKLIGTYEYDLWGRPVSVTEATKGIDTDGILTKNPFRYRGYYYDTETGFYNLNARYYDPEIRRFDNLINDLHQVCVIFMNAQPCCIIGFEHTIDELNCSNLKQEFFEQEKSGIGG